MNLRRAAIVIAMGWTGMCFAAGQDDGHRPGRRALADLDRLDAALPTSPVTWIAPGGGAVLHGDLFGDGRHLAVVEEEGRTLLMVAAKGQWRQLDSFDIRPAWVPEGVEPSACGYPFIRPPAQPFSLSDLDGDAIPEVLVAWNDDGYTLGYRILRKVGALVRMPAVSSDQVPPVFRGGFLVVSESFGRKAWGSGKDYYRWVDGTPVLTASEWENVKDPEKTCTIICRYAEKRMTEKFCIRQQDEAEVITRCSPDSDGREASGEKPYVGVKFGTKAVGGNMGQPSDTAMMHACDAWLFQKLTGLDWTVQIRQGDDTPPADVVKAMRALRAQVSGGTSSLKEFEARSTPKS